ncbi:class I SAM-dependent methyltransferase [Yinghuangia seranimata]|uniref:class I SAM-dependent methyltransferase n=1 Tax=Yinghuangia seranimata TaxID=408067 RepID=UPI00248BF788|nr:class I SAM-dependent methyltransferase [Yinghuangia seranimata]MDI2131162.1 class I SAM-dependent methyltransferase [Yinghuangia seranimata]
MTTALHEATTWPMDLQTQVQREIASRQLAEHLVRLRTRGPLKVLDVGCGPATPALLLARAGHLVTAVSTDTLQLTALHDELADEPDDVRARLRLVEGDGSEAGRHFPPGSFDLALCHDALDTLDEPDGMLAALARILNPGGLLSVTARNGAAAALRTGAAGEWTATRKALAARSVGAADPARPDSAEGLSVMLADLGTPVLSWYGVGVFTALRPEEPAPPRNGKAWQNLVAVEEEAGRTDPYRGIASVLHLVGEKTIR